MLSREQMSRERNRWIEHASSDLKNNIESLMERENMNEEEISNRIGVSVEAIFDVLDGDISQIKVEELAIMFIACNLAFCVTPMRNAPIGGTMGHPMGSPMGERNVVPQGGSRPIEPSPFFDENEDSDEDRDEEQDVTDRPLFDGPADEDNPYRNLSIDDLKNIIYRNLWDTELDINHSSRQDLIDFIMEKERRFAQQHESRIGNGRVGNGTTVAQRPVRGSEPFSRAVAAAPTEHVSRVRCGKDGKFDSVIDAILNAAERDPRLAEQLRKITTRG